MATQLPNPQTQPTQPTNRPPNQPTNHPGTQDGKAEVVERMAAVLEAAGMRDVVALPRARVPVCKCMDPNTGTRLDVTVGRPGGWAVRAERVWPLIDTRLERVGLPGVWGGPGSVGATRPRDPPNS